MRSSYKKVSGMTAEIKIRRCYGCGATLQSLDRFDSGYVSPERAKDDEGLCDTCFKLRHPSSANANAIDKDYVAMVNKGKADGALFCYVLDGFSLDASALPQLSELLKGARVLGVLNKVDVLPDEVSPAEAVKGLSGRLAEQGIALLGVVSTATSDDSSIVGLMAKVNDVRQGKDVYFVGGSKVGKSAIVNEYLKFFDNTTDRPVAKVKIGEGDATMTAIPLDEGSTLYDTPGVFDPRSLLSQVDRKAFRYVSPRTRVQARPFVLKPGEGLLLGALSYLTLEKGDRAELTAFFSKDVEIVPAKADRIADQFTELASTEKGRPASPTIRDSSALAKTEIALPDNGKETLLSIYGFGRFKLVSHGEVIAVYAPKGVAVGFRQE